MRNTPLDPHRIEREKLKAINQDIFRFRSPFLWMLNNDIKNALKHVFQRQTFDMLNRSYEPGAAPFPSRVIIPRSVLRASTKIK